MAEVYSRDKTSLNQNKVPPHSIDAEQAVLGGLMLDNQAWDKVVELVSAQDFYRADHRIIFQTMEDLIRREHPLDMLTVSERLKATQQLEHAGGEIYIFDLAKNTPSAANIAAYAGIVRERSVLRQLISAANEISEIVFSAKGKDTNDILDSAERLVFNIAEQTARGSGPLSIKDYVAKSFERIDMLYHSDEAITGIPSGFTDFDDKTSGLQNGDLVIIAGRPSMGKTTFAINIAENAAFKTQRPVLIFSMEMPGDHLAMRMMSSWARIDQHKVRTGKLSDEDWPRLTGAMNALNEMPLFIDDTAALSPQELRARARRVAREQGDLGLIVVDYLQLMKIPGYSENRTGEISEISRSLKSLAKELNVPVIALSQLNRSLEQRHDRRPIMSDLRESGAIEQDADLIVFIYRDEVYNENSPDKGKAEIIIAKQRNGPIGKVMLTFLGQYTKFENYAANDTRVYG
ncbi:MAG: replicative DNA helicase [Legionellales bacterium]|nr:replicative DNA helicase [Legionellales bacterium]